MIAFWANCFHSFANKPMSIFESVDINKIIPVEKHKLSLLKSIENIRTLISVKVPTDDSNRDEGRAPEQFAIFSYRNINAVLEKRKTKERHNLDPYIMRTLIGSKIYATHCQEQNLLSANKVTLKAKSVFIHLSIVEEGDLFNVDRFNRMHPFTDFIPELIAFLTQKCNSELHTISLEIIHSYLCASLNQSENTNPYKHAPSQILNSLGVTSNGTKPVHRILHDLTSLKIVQSQEENLSAFDTPEYQLKSRAGFLPNETAKDPAFCDQFLEVLYLISTQFRNNTRSFINELLKFLDAKPQNGYYVFKHSQVTKAARILHYTLKNNYEEFKAVERTITRLKVEINLILKDSHQEIPLENWRYIQAKDAIIHGSSRQEFFRVLFRLLNGSIFKNDPNFASNSKKILDNGLLTHCLKLFAENREENSNTHDVVLVCSMHLISLVINDLPAQIPKACDSFLNDTFKSLEQRVPNYIEFYLALLKLITAVSIHDKGREQLKLSKLIEKAMLVPLEPGYGYHYINCDKAYEYHQYLRDLLRNDDEYRKRAVIQLLKNVDYLIESSVALANKPKEQIEDGRLKDKFDDQLDSFFNLLHHIIEDNTRMNNEKIIEKSVCSAEMSEKLLTLFKVPIVADAIAKETIIYKEVFKSFITEYPKLLENVHADLISSLDSVEKILGPLENATDFLPENRDMDVAQENNSVEVTKSNITTLEYIKRDDEKLRVLYCLIKNYSTILRSSSRRFDAFLGMDISSTIKRLVSLRRAIIMGGSDLYATKLKEEFETHKESILEFDKKIEEHKRAGEESHENEEADPKIIGELKREEYMKRYKIVGSNNYATANFAGVLEFDKDNVSDVEREAEQCQTEVNKLVHLWWKKKIQRGSEMAGKNIEAIVDSTIFMSTVLSHENLNNVIDPKNFDLDKVDINEAMASFAKFNQVVEEYTKLMSSDSPYITNFYMKKGFRNVFGLYHWLRAVTPIFEQLKVKRILFSKHIQLLWSNIGDHFASVVECKFLKDGRDPPSCKTDKHKDTDEFVSSLFYHICSEIFKQEDIEGILY